MNNSLLEMQLRQMDELENVNAKRDVMTDLQKKIYLPQPEKRSTCSLSIVAGYGAALCRVDCGALP